MKSKMLQSMKRIISNVMLIAAAATAFFSCQKQESFEPGTAQEVILTFTSEKPAFSDETKTEWTGETIQWSKGDKIRVAYTADGVWQNADGNATVDEENGNKTAKIYASTSVEAGETASFSVPGTFSIPTGVVLEFYGVYPSTASDADMPYAPSVTVKIPAEQKPLENSFDSKADLMAARSVSTYILTEENPLPEAIPLMWTRLVAHGYFTLKNLAVVGEENIESIVLTADDEADMVGQHHLYLDTYNVVKPSGNSVPNKLTIDATNLTIADNSVSFWACFLPCTWKSVAVQVETDKATYTREIDLTANQKTFAKNARNTLSINMETATRDEKEVSVGTLPFEKDFSEMNGTAELTELDGFSELSYVYQNTSSIRLATTKAAGLLKTNPLNLSQNFHVIVTARGWADDELRMTVSAGEQEHNVDLTTYGTDGEFVEYVMNFTPVGESATVSFTAAKDKRYYIQKIQVLADHAELPSTLTVTAPEQMSAEGGKGSFSYTLTNPKDGKALTATTEAEWITDIEVNEGNVSYTVLANSSEEPREATITLKYEGVDDVPVTVAQAGYVDPNQIHKVTVAEFSALTGTETATYELTGVVSGIYQVYNPSFDNISFYIEDATGEVLIFRMDCNDDASLASLKVGDKVTVQGKPTLYNETIQMAQGGVCTNHIAACEAPVISCVDNIVTITAETGATIYYTLDGNDPTESSDVYSAPFEITETKTVKAIAVAEGKPQSVVVEQLCKVVNGDVESVKYELLFGASYNSGKISSYTNTWTATNNDFTCTLANWNNNNNGWSYIKAGSKNSASVATITTKDAVPEALTTVTMTVDAVTTTKINSLKLYVSTDVNFTTKDTYTATAAKGDVVFNISTPVENAYYKIEVDCAKGTSNGLITVSKVVFAN